MVVGLLGNESPDSNRFTLVIPKPANGVRLQATLGNQNPTGLPVGAVSVYTTKEYRRGCCTRRKIYTGVIENISEGLFALDVGAGSIMFNDFDVEKIEKNTKENVKAEEKTESKIESKNYISTKKGLTYSLNKLAEYEDLDSNQLLITLPCRLGSTVYKIVKCQAPSCKQCMKPSSVDDCYKIGKARIIEGYFTYNDIAEFGKTVFKTRKQAEEQLTPKPISTTTDDGSAVLFDGKTISQIASESNYKKLEEIAASLADY